MENSVSEESLAENERVKAGQIAGAEAVDKVNGVASETAPTDGIYGPKVEGELPDTTETDAGVGHQSTLDDKEAPAPEDLAKK